MGKILELPILFLLPVRSTATVPLADLEQGGDGFIHDPKGRRIKLGLTYRFGTGKVDGSGCHPLLLWRRRNGCAAASLTKPYD